eukprot:TRINITY_DN105406_c4_g1_i1.p2 TRINITY_DN105406_c4_g1~~TRINITY_DN105406_c4_g1_i1.p2  ORF type:complete len:849 (+),score=138.53 TRINITY_DN105406_c4_g1_i1:84-2549(+)
MKQHRKENPFSIQAAAYVKESAKWVRSRIRPQSAKANKVNTSSIQQQTPAMNNKSSGRPITSVSRTVIAENNSCQKINATFSTPSKHVPKNIQKDKEDLYDEVIRLKKELNNGKAELKKLKTQISIQEKDLSKKDAYIKELLASKNSKAEATAKTKPDTYLITALKKKIKELHSKNIKKDSEITTIRHNVKTTKIYELESELSTSLEECKRLRAMLEEFSNKGGGTEQPMSKPSDSKKPLQKVQEENEELVKALQQKEEGITMWKEKAKKAEKKVQSLEKEVNETKEVIAEAKKAVDEKEAMVKLLRGKLNKEQQEVPTEPKKLPIVHPGDIPLTVAELKIFLITSKIPYPTIYNELFSATYKMEDTISIHELEKLLMRKVKPNKEYADFNKLARYLIEPREPSTVTYNVLAEAGLNQVMDRINTLIPEYELFIQGSTNEKNVQSSLVSKFADRMFGLSQTLGSIETEPNMISFDCIDQLTRILNLQLTPSEKDYIIYVMYQESRNVKRLPFQALLKKLEELGCKADPKIEEKPITLEEVVNKVENEDELNEMQEEEIIELAQRCFLKVANAMSKSKKTVKSLFGDDIAMKFVEGEGEIEVIKPEDFFKGLKKVGILNLQPLEAECLLKVLATSDAVDDISVDNLVQILEDYGIIDPESRDSSKNSNFLNLAKLDDISMVIMLALAEYLMQEKVPLYELFGNVIYTQNVKTKTKERTVELIDSNEFFKIVREIGIDLEDEEHENLKEFLCLDLKYKNKLYMKKLKKAVEEFAFNEELRGAAKKCYENVANMEEEYESENMTLQCITSNIQCTVYELTVQYY